MLAPLPWTLDHANRAPPGSPAQQVAPPAYFVLIGQLGRPMTDATPTPDVVQEEMATPGGKHLLASW
jgi:hypothetical protein